MPRVSGGIPNLINGVSQQPDALRLGSQGKEQINAYSTVVDGLTKRPPSQFISRLTEDTSQSDSGWVTTHIINRDEVEQYVVVASNNSEGFSLEAFDFLGTKRDVSLSSTAIAYMQEASREDLRFLTIADYTIVLNKNKTVAMSEREEDIIAERDPEAIVNVKAGNYARTYSITLNGMLAAEYKAPNGESASEAPRIDVKYIAEQLHEDLGNRGFTSANGWTTYQISNTVYISRTEDFTVETEDGFNGRAMNVVKDEVQDFSDLPFFCVNGMSVQVINSTSTEFDDYRVTFEAPSGDRGRGHWRESPDIGIPLAFDPATMPHALIREADGSFTMEPILWNRRVSGDEDSTPSASFVGRKLNDVFFYKNRLGFLSDENVVMSRSGDFFNFFRTTATDLLDDDPIDVAVSHNKVSILNHAVAFQDRLILFSTQTQFQLRGSELLTPKTVSLRPTTEFESSSIAKPVGTGRNIYFPVNRGGFTMLREYFFSDNTEIADADDVTAHVPQYVPRNLTKLEASSHEDVLVCHTPDDPQTLYMYKYLWVDNNKVQSSWSKWTLPDSEEILDLQFLESALYVVVRRQGYLYLEAIEVQPGVQDAGIQYVIHLDRRVYIEGPDAHVSYDPFENVTTFNLPYEPDDKTICVSAGSVSYTPERQDGLQFDVVSYFNTEITVRGDLRRTPVYFGQRYNSKYILSTIFIREQASSGGLQARTEGRLQLQHVQMQYSDTGFFEVNVTPEARTMRPYFFNGRRMGDPNNITGQTVLSEGSFRFPVLSRNDRVKIEVVSDSYLPFSLLSVEWTGMYVDRAERV